MARHSSELGRTALGRRRERCLRHAPARSTRSTRARLLELLGLLGLVGALVVVATPGRALADGELPDVRPGGGLPQGLVGRVVRKVELVAEGARWKTAPPLRSRVGSPLTETLGRELLRELVATGRVASASVSAEPDGDGVKLVVRFVPRRLVAKVDVVGGVLDRRETLDVAGLGDGAELTPSVLDEARPKLAALYDKRGFPRASVKLDTTDTDDPLRVVVELGITPGPPRNVGQRVFVIKPEEDRHVGDLKARYKVAAGARADETVLAEADRELTDLLQQKSFPRARVQHRVVDRGAGAVLYVYVEAGPMVTFAFEGNRAFDADELSRALTAGARPGESGPSYVAERLRAFYVARGYYDVEPKVVELATDDPGVRVLKATVREGRQVRVVRRVFPCLTPDPGLEPSRLGEEIDSFLEEDLPGNDLLWPGSPSALGAIFGPAVSGGRAPPPALNPAMTYAPEVYDRALKHLRELVVSRGYLNAVVGPVSLVRETCDRASRTAACKPLPPKDVVVARCAKDPLGLPIAEPPVPDSAVCVPDAARGVECSPEVTLRIPIHLGPRTALYDVAFEGNKTLTARELGALAALEPGGPLSQLALDQAKVRILDEYKRRGHAFAEVRTTVEPSPDRTRARARFIVIERDVVIVSGIELRGATRTAESLVRRRLALEVGKPYSTDRVRRSEEGIATLGTFSSVTISLENPEIPARNKRVVVNVSELLPQYLDPRLGFSSGEGARFAFEYGHRNIGGLAIALTLRIQLAYLFEFMVLDPQVRANYAPLSVLDRLERRNTISLAIPDIGLGAYVGLSLDGIDVRDNQRDFGLTKQAVIPTLSYRPSRQIAAQLSTSAELNDVRIFNEAALQGAFNLLRVPTGRTVALSQRLKASLDLRDSALSATKGGFFTLSVEHVNALPVDIGEANPATISSHFLRLSGRVAGYIPFGASGISLALSLAGGFNVQLESSSETYPDRLFFLGGVDSIRAFLPDTVVPEDIARQIEAADPNDPNAATIERLAIRGGDLALNPRIELRVPIRSVFQAGVFFDTGNLWFNPGTVDLLTSRYALGAGLRISTPAGPLALDYGINLARRAWEDFGAFHFSVGLF